MENIYLWKINKTKTKNVHHINVLDRKLSGLIVENKCNMQQVYICFDATYGFSHHHSSDEEESVLLLKRYLISRNNCTNKHFCVSSFLILWYLNAIELKLNLLYFKIHKAKIISKLFDAFTFSFEKVGILISCVKCLFYVRNRFSMTLWCFVQM